MCHFDHIGECSLGRGERLDFSCALRVKTAFGLGCSFSGSRLSSSCGRLGFLLQERHVDAVDSAGRTSCFALAAERTLVGIDIREVVGNGDSIVSANGLTLTATDTAVLASFAGNSAFGLARAEHYHTHTIVAFLANLNNVARTCFSACTAGRTFVVIYLRQTGLGIDLDSAKLTSSYAVAATEATECAVGLADIHAVHDGAGAGAAED